MEQPTSLPSGLVQAGFPWSGRAVASFDNWTKGNAIFFIELFGPYHRTSVKGLRLGEVGGGWAFGRSGWCWVGDPVAVIIDFCGTGGGRCPGGCGSVLGEGICLGVGRFGFWALVRLEVREWFVG